LISTKKISCIGEILWDLFPDKKRPGGAPANVAYHAARLKADSTLVSKVGDDSAGSELMHYLHGKGVNTGYIQIDHHHETGRVEVFLDENNDPSYTIVEPAAWDFIEKKKSLEILAAGTDAVVFGTLAQRNPVSAASIRWFLDKANPAALRLLDVNFRPPFVFEEAIRESLLRADVIKVNHEEVESLKDIFKTSDLFDYLLDSFRLRGICVTKGMEGSEWISKEEHFSQDIFESKSDKGDPVGLGDGFTAVLAVELTHSGNAKLALERASRYTALLAGKKGGMPEISQTEINYIFKKG